MTSNLSFNFPARTVESTTEMYGTFHVSNTHRVHPSSIAASKERYKPTRGTGLRSVAVNPGYPGVARGAATGAESGTRRESGATIVDRPIRRGSVCAVTS